MNLVLDIEVFKNVIINMDIIISLRNISTVRNNRRNS